MVRVRILFVRTCAHVVGGPRTGAFLDSYVPLMDFSFDVLADRYIVRVRSYETIKYRKIR